MKEVQKMAKAIILILIGFTLYWFLKSIFTAGVEEGKKKRKKRKKHENK